MITIGRLAALFGITHHQIRYYEEKNIFSFTHIEANGYRMYDLDAVYRLAQILFLRELDLSVAQIKTIQMNYSEDDYQKLISEKMKEIDATILRLTKVKEQLCEQLISKNQDNEKSEHIPAFQLEKLLTLKLSEKVTAEVLIVVLGMERMLTENMYYLFDPDCYHVCVKSEEFTSSAIAFKTANYRVYTHYIEGEEESDQKLIELKEQHQRYPDFVIEKHTLLINQVSKVEISYYYNLAYED